MIEFPKKTLMIEFTTISSNRKENDFLSLGKENHTFFFIFHFFCQVVPKIYIF